MFKVSEITEAEIARSAEIVRESFKTVAEEFGITEDNTPTHGTFLKDEKLLKEFESGVKMFGLYEWEKQVGFVALESGDGETYFLEKLAVLPEFRHQKGGKELMDYAIEYVRKAGGKAISIGIIYENYVLLEWYKGFGFEETGTKIFPNFPFTVCFMKKEI